MTVSTYDQVIKFWFEELTPEEWWKKDPELDANIRKRFDATLTAAALGELYTWRQSDEGRLAEIIVLDQFSRNIFRGHAQAYACDGMALVLAQEAVNAHIDQNLSVHQAVFLYMPFMHSESKIVHAQAEQLFNRPELVENFEFELKHKAIIDRFGRYPHRNAVLGRVSTEAEIEFLKSGESSF